MAEAKKYVAVDVETYEWVAVGTLAELVIEIGQYLDNWAGDFDSYTDIKVYELGPQMVLDVRTEPRVEIRKAS